MKIVKKAIAFIITIILLISSTSCFDALFRPVEGLKGLPAYTLTEDEVKEAESLLQEAERVTIAKKSTYEINLSWNSFIETYYYVTTQANVAFVWYCMDLTNAQNKQNYLFSNEAASNLYGKYTESLKNIYNSESRDLFFEGWSQAQIDSVLKHDETVVALENRNAELEVEQNELSSDKFYDGTTEIYKEIVKNNNEIAKAEILNIVESESGFLNKKELIDAQLSECKDYFDSIMAQINI